MPKLSDAEMARYRSSLYGVAAIGHVPKVCARLSSCVCPPQRWYRPTPGLCRSTHLRGIAV